MRRFLLIVLPLLGTLAAGTGAAQAVVVDMNPATLGQTSVAYPTDLNSGSYYGVSLVPNAREGTSTTASYLASAGIPVVSSTAPCADPAAGVEPDILSGGSWPLSAPTQPICWHNGGVMHANETFTLEWEGQAPHTYWSTTKNYVQTFLSDVAGASGSLTSPYSDTTQYWDGPAVQDRAANSSLFGGGCNDNGTAQCQFGTTTGSGPGNPLPSSSTCTVSGDNIYGGSQGGALVTIPNDLCLTDAQIRNEVTTLVDKDGLIAHTQSGYTPLVVVLTPPGAEVCLEATGALCSANGRVSPPPPTLATTTTGGLIPAGNYHVVVTYNTSSGETLPSAPGSVTTTGSASAITVTSPAPHTGVTGWYAYVTGPGGATYTRQGSVASTIGNTLTLTSLTSSGPVPPSKPASFCSYHAQVVDPQSGQAVTYVVQPWTPFTMCDEPDSAQLGVNPTPEQLSKNAAERLVSPLSQSVIPAIVNPAFTGWFGLDGLEVNDQNGCQPLGSGLDSFTIGSSAQNTYLLQREFNNTAVVNSDPHTYGGCLPKDELQPAFVAPSAISLGDTLDLDGSATATSLGIPNASYTWDFGDGATGVGPSVEHTYSDAGTYTVKLTVTDRGGNAASVSQSVQVLTKNGLPVPAPAPPPANTAPGSGSGSAGPFNVKLQLLPQGLRTAVRHGIAVQVNSNEAADGFAQVWITRGAAKRAHVKRGRHALVLVGFGTVSGIKAGMATLNVHMRPRLARRLGHLHHLKLTVRLVLTGSDGHHVVVDVAGTY